MGNKKGALNDLREFLKKLPPGKVQGENEEKIKSLLFDCWDDLESSSDTSMSIFKLHRIENLAWQPPNKLEFDIERHGSTVVGSVYADLYHWTIDLDNRQAHFDYPKKRLVGTRDKPLKVEPIAKKILQEILGFDKDSENLEWKYNCKTIARRKYTYAYRDKKNIVSSPISSNMFHLMPLS